jgi:hypothetical protein
MLSWDLILDSSILILYDFMMFMMTVTMTVAMTVIIMAMCVTSNMAVGMIIVRV